MPFRTLLKALEKRAISLQTHENQTHQKGKMREYTKELKRRIKALSPAQKIAAVENIHKRWVNQWATKEEDFWEYVYVIKCNEYYKIGIAVNMGNRLNQIRTGNPYPIEKILAIKSPKAAIIEKELHVKYKGKQHRGEWFNLQITDIEEIKTFIENYGRIEAAKSGIC